MPDPARVVCSRCQANNFSTQAACWKCGAPLVGGASAPSPVLGSPSGASPSALPYRDTIDPGIAFWSAIALAVLFPSVGLIVGLLFLMFDDRRRAEIGRITLIWSVVFFIVHTVFTGMLLGNAMRQFLPMLNSIRAGQSQQQPNLNDKVPDHLIPSGFPQGFPTP